MPADSLRKKLVRQLGGCLPQGLKRYVASRFKRTIDRVTGDDRAAIARRYIVGDGIEIGALASPLTAPKSARVKYVDRMSAGDLRKHYPELQSQDIVDTDIVCDGERLEAIRDSSQDFVIANHFIEHCQNPIAAILNMLRVLKPGGVLYLAIPDKRYTFDRDRPVVSLDHLVRDYEEGPKWSNRQHFEEWVRMVKRIEDHGEVEREVDRLLAADYSIHYHVWTQTEMSELLLFLRRELDTPFDVQLFLKNEGECIFVLRTERASGE